MMDHGSLHNPQTTDTAAGSEDAIFPQGFGFAASLGKLTYSRDPLIRDLICFFENKGLAALKAEDRAERWYDDWVAFQSQRRIYAQLLSPKHLSISGGEFDLLRFTRFLEVFAYYSPAHGYSLQVTFLGLFAILMGDNPDLKREAVASLEAGALLAFGVSEKRHGSDLLGNEFTIREVSPGRFLANGAKYYIGNANAASMISILGRKEDPRGPGFARRSPLVLLALRPNRSSGFQNVRKIATLGVRSAFVGEFEVKDHELPQTDQIAQGREAWDAIFGTVTLGKFFLGFGSIGICEHAFEEAAAHLCSRTLYGKPAIEMPHLRRAMAQAYTRLAAMKLYAYRALDYVQACSAVDRRYVLFCAVQKARVSTEGVKVMSLLSECIGAKAFESDTYFEMALRDAPLIPSLEGSTHINLKLAAQFIPRYFCNPEPDVADPPSLHAGETRPAENPYLMAARTGVIDSVAFPHFLAAYESLFSIPNVRIFARQAKAFQLMVRKPWPACLPAAESPATQAMGQCLAVTAYAQLIAEHALRLHIPVPMIAAIFHTLVTDFSTSALALASCTEPDLGTAFQFRRMMSIPKTSHADWGFVAERMLGTRVADASCSATPAGRRTE